MSENKSYLVAANACAECEPITPFNLHFCQLVLKESLAKIWKHHIDLNVLNPRIFFLFFKLFLFWMQLLNSLSHIELVIFLELWRNLFKNQRLRRFSFLLGYFLGGCWKLQVVKIWTRLSRPLRPRLSFWIIRLLQSCLLFFHKTLNRDIIIEATTLATQWRNRPPSVLALWWLRLWTWR